MCTPFHAGFRTAGNIKRIAKEIDHDEKLDRLENAKHEIKVKGNDTRARSAVKNVDVGQRIMRTPWRLWTIFWWEGENCVS